MTEEMLFGALLAVEGESGGANRVLDAIRERGALGRLAAGRRRSGYPTRRLTSWPTVCVAFCPWPRGAAWR